MLIGCTIKKEIHVSNWHFQPVYAHNTAIISYRSYYQFPILHSQVYNWLVRVEIITINKGAVGLFSMRYDILLLYIQWSIMNELYRNSGFGPFIHV